MAGHESLKWPWRITKNHNKNLTSKNFGQSLIPSPSAHEQCWEAYLIITSATVATSITSLLCPPLLLPFSLCCHHCHLLHHLCHHCHYHLSSYCHLCFHLHHCHLCCHHHQCCHHSNCNLASCCHYCCHLLYNCHLCCNHQALITMSI